MSIPLDRLYQYLDTIAKEIDKSTIIYRFWPHGSKKLENLLPLDALSTSTWYNTVMHINLICHDQEPLLYAPNDFSWANHVTKTLQSLSLMDSPEHNLSIWPSIYEKTCLVHSEKRSHHVESYEKNRCVPVYYWSHAVIARDWFRYAEHIEQKKQVTKIFLIYNRAWSGTREYRLRFAEFLVHSGLQDLCKTTVNPVEPELGIHYNQHQFENLVWCPQTVLEDYFPVSTARSTYSADFDIGDYEATDIEVVLETLFDDSRLHLTEKSLRPIACAQPFILAGTHGSLEYLRSYGFQTFADVWDESYDQITDPCERLGAIVDLMSQIANWDTEIRDKKMFQARAIAEHNRRHFFSQSFVDQVVNEFKSNLGAGIQQVKDQANFQRFVDLWKKRLEFEQVQHLLENADGEIVPSSAQVHQVLDELKKLD